MKTKLASLLVVLFVSATTQLSAQRFTVQPVNDDISYYLDLKAVASVFGDSRNLEDFERRLNNDDDQISNLDLNGDGEIDYLRVIETYENNLHLIVIQAILDRDVYQDVATIVVDKDNYNNVNVQVIGDPYLYGYNYVIEPQYIRLPGIISWFWAPRYRTWISPYRWGYYPRYYRYRHPIGLNLYLSHIHHHINYNHKYYYNEHFRNDHAFKLKSSISRNDFGVRYPDRDFRNRNNNVGNRYDFEKRNDHSYRSRDNRNERNFDRSDDNHRMNSNRDIDMKTGSDYNRGDDRRDRNRFSNPSSNDNINSPARNNNSQGFDKGDNNKSDNGRVFNRNEDRREVKNGRQENTENRPTNVIREQKSNQDKVSEPRKPVRETPRVESRSNEKSRSAESPKESRREKRSSDDSRR